MQWESRRKVKVGIVLPIVSKSASWHSTFSIAPGLPEKKFKMTADIREIMAHIVNTEIVLAEAKNDYKYAQIRIGVIWQLHLLIDTVMNAF